jgi:hypothetical protein
VIIPWNQTTIPKPQKRDFDGKYTWVMSPRWYHEGEAGDKKHLALDTAVARLRDFGRQRWPVWSISVM